MVSKSRLSGIVLLPLIAILVYVPSVNAAPPSMSLDGVAIGNSYSCNTSSCSSLCSNHINCSASATLTTTDANDVIVVIAQCGIFANCGSNFPTPSSVDNITSIVDDAGHTWTLRAAYTPPHGRPIWEYFTVADSPLSSDRINVTWSGSNVYVGFVAWASAEQILNTHGTHRGNYLRNRHSLQAAPIQERVPLIFHPSQRKTS